MMMNNNMLVLACTCPCPCPSYVFTKSVTDHPILTLSRSSSCLPFKIPPPNKGFLHIGPQLMGSGPVLSLSPATEFTFLITVTPVAKNFEADLKPMDMLVETEVPRAASGAVGSVKAIGNYASIMKTLDRAKANGFSDVLYLDPAHRTYLGDTSTANVFVVKENIISTPVLQGTILPGITRKTVIDIAKSQGFKKCWQFNVLFKDSGLGVVSEQLRTILDDIQMGASEDKWGWTVEFK
ncbi:hypothetical protein ACFE04_007116 [Oxalis oulophora]